MAVRSYHLACTCSLALNKRVMNAVSCSMSPGSLWNARLGLALCFKSAEPHSLRLRHTLMSSRMTSHAPSHLAMVATGCRRHWMLATDWRSVFGMRAAPCLTCTFISSCRRPRSRRPPRRSSAGDHHRAVGLLRHERSGDKGRSGGDMARLLPIIDLANYGVGERANAELRNAPKDGEMARQR